jgi:hypothetical protein
VWVYFSTLTPVDFTLRIASPQLERGPITPPVWPPVGTPAVTTRALLATPYVTNYAEIDGQGGVQANGLVTRPANAQIDGEGGKTNWIRNPRGDGAVIGGDLPTYWSAPLLPGMSMNVLGQGVDAASGVPYVDVQFFGTTFADGNLFLYIEPSTFKIAAPGDTFVTTAWLGITGSLFNIGSVYYIATIQTGSITTLISPTPTFSRYGGSGTVGVGADSIGLCYFQLFVKAGALNITLRLGGFQLERGTIRTPLILPPQDAPDITDRALLAQPVTLVSASALIRGRGSVRLDMGVGTLQGLARIGGDGNILADGQTPGRAYASALLWGWGGVAPRPVLRSGVTATIRGAGALTGLAGVRVPAGVFRWVGLGKVQASASALRPAAAKIQGAGDIDITPRARLPALARIGGVGAAGVSDTQIVSRANARISGVGGVAARGYSPLAEIRGLGTVRATVTTVLRRALARISGVGGLREAATRLVPTRARISGEGLVEADIDKVHRVNQVTLGGAGQVRAVGRVARPAGATINGAGRFGASARQLWRVAARISGTGGVRAVNAPNRITQQAAARINGAGHFAARGAVIAHGAARLLGVAAARASAYVLGPPKQASARISGLGALRVSIAAVRETATSHLTGVGGVRANPHAIARVPAAARITGTGGLHATVRAVRVGRATITGTAAVRASDHVRALARALITGLGRVQATAFRLPKFTAATIHGAGGVRATGSRVQTAGARINGRGSVTAHPAVAMPALSRIAGAGRVRIIATAQLHVRVSIHGMGDIDDDPDVKGVVRAVARINGRGGLKPDPFVPRDRVALYGVHLPPTKRGVSV